MKSSLVFTVIVICVFGVLAKIARTNRMSGSLSRVISWKSFMVLALMFRSLIQFHLLFPHGVKICILSPFRIAPRPVLPQVCLSFSKGSGARAWGFESHLHFLPAVWLWASSSTSLCLRFLICKVDVLITVHTSCVFYKDAYTKSSQRVSEGTGEHHWPSRHCPFSWSFDLGASFSGNILLQGHMHTACACVVKMSPGSGSWLLLVGPP